VQEVPDFAGAPEEIRTPDPQIRSVHGDVVCRKGTRPRHYVLMFLRSCLGYSDLHAKARQNSHVALLGFRSTNRVI